MTVYHHHIFSAETGYGSVPGRQSEFLATEKQRDPTTIVISSLDGVVGGPIRPRYIQYSTQPVGGHSVLEKTSDTVKNFKYPRSRQSTKSVGGCGCNLNGLGCALGRPIEKFPIKFIPFALHMGVVRETRASLRLKKISHLIG